MKPNSSLNPVTYVKMNKCEKESICGSSHHGMIILCANTEINLGIIRTKHLSAVTLKSKYFVYSNRPVGRRAQGY